MPLLTEQEKDLACCSRLGVGQTPLNKTSGKIGYFIEAA
jgi:hypothetical protein